MDDKNKYNNALEKLQEALTPKDGCEISGLTRGCIEEIFPELAESKDEKIRKELIEHIKANKWADYVLFQKFSPEDVIAWLEKQGEKPQGKTAFEAIKEKPADNANKVESNPAWSYEDEANLNNIIWLCNNCIKGSETTWIPSQATKIKHLIETIKEKGLAQQTYAWSEEDERIALGIEQLCNCASFLNISPDKIDKVKQWLKSLKERIKTEQNIVSKWRPSNAQIKALEHFIIGIGESGYASPYDANLKLVYSLLNDLKKIVKL